jgi:hypothetical protein
VSQAAKDFVHSLLKLEPVQRLDLQQMMHHEFMSSNKIPDLMPVSTLVCIPAQEFVHKYKV